MKPKSRKSTTLLKKGKKYILFRKKINEKMPSKQNKQANVYGSTGR
jgi:hypothetical protein